MKMTSKNFHEHMDQVRALYDDFDPDSRCYALAYTIAYYFHRIHRKQRFDYMEVFFKRLQKAMNEAKDAEDKIMGDENEVKH